MADAQTPSLDPSVDEVQVVIYVDLEPGRATNGSALLVEQVKAEARTEGCRGAFLIKEDGRPNHFIVVERWRASDDLNALRNSGMYNRFRTQLQPTLASPLDERVGHQTAP